VVYKVDRLTRSLADFAKIVEIFDKAGASFVSVTQQFNTTTSMGRLTLNVLLSFAQFEREVTGERIRDKIAASKQKGMWMGGWVPLGYDRKDRALTINEAEAKTVRTIFELFLKFKNVRKLQADLIRQKLTTKRYPTTSGRVLGGLTFSRGHLYRILSNPLYIGEIVHKKVKHSGQHPPIIDQKTWQVVQALLNENRNDNRTRTNAKSQSLLAGLIYDENGNRLVSTHANKSGKRYRYYVTSEESGRNATTNRKQKLRLPAAEIDAAVINALVAFLRDQDKLADRLKEIPLKSGELATTLRNAEKLVRAIEAAKINVQHATISDLVVRVDVSAPGLKVTFAGSKLMHELGVGEIAGEISQADIQLQLPLNVATSGGSTKLVINRPSEGKPDRAKVTAIARGTCWFEELTSGKAQSIRHIAKREGVTERYISRLIEQALISSELMANYVEHS
jgi:site-specific DNA recombinase